MLHWVLHTDGGLLARVGIGCAIFTVLAVVDYRRRGPAATKWREYGVLLAAVVAALIYGAVNDQVTVSISPEYFIWGKELYQVVGQNPDPGRLRWEAAKVGLKATWSVGLILGVLLLLANNPFRGWPRWRNRRLVVLIPVILLSAAVLGAVGGWLGYRGVYTSWQSDFRDLVDANAWRPKRFMATWGVHLGGYVGGSLGAVGSAVFVVFSRWRMSGGEVRGWGTDGHR